MQIEPAEAFVSQREWLKLKEATLPAKHSIQQAEGKNIH
jgi:hypothetical protein